jgi:predicted small lipoprotein YifL
MLSRVISALLVCCCLLLALPACGNKGPLVPAGEEEKKQKTETTTE